MDPSYLHLLQANPDLFYSILVSYPYLRLEKLLDSSLSDLAQTRRFWTNLWRARFLEPLPRGLENAPVKELAQIYYQENILQKVVPMVKAYLNQMRSDNTVNYFLEKFNDPSLTFEQIDELLNELVFRTVIIFRAIEDDDIDLYYFAKIPLFPGISLDEAHKMNGMDVYHNLVEEYLATLSDEEYQAFLKATDLQTLIILPQKITDPDQECNYDLVEEKLSSDSYINGRSYANAIYAAKDADCPRVLHLLMKNISILLEEDYDTFFDIILTSSLKQGDLELLEWLFSLDPSRVLIRASGITIHNWKDPHILSKLFRKQPQLFSEVLLELVIDQNWPILSGILIRSHAFSQDHDRALNLLEEISSSDVDTTAHLEMVIENLAQTLTLDEMQNLKNNSQNRAVYFTLHEIVKKETQKI